MEHPALNGLLDQHGTLFHGRGHAKVVRDHALFGDVDLFFEERNHPLVILGHRESSADQVGETTGRGFLANSA